MTAADTSSHTPICTTCGATISDFSGKPTAHHAIWGEIRRLCQHCAAKTLATRAERVTDE